MGKGKDSSFLKERAKSLISSPGSAINRESQIPPGNLTFSPLFLYRRTLHVFFFSLSPAHLRLKEVSAELGESRIELCLPQRMLQVMYTSDSGVEQSNQSKSSWHSKILIYTQNSGATIKHCMKPA